MAQVPGKSPKKSETPAPEGEKLCTGYTVYIQIYGPELRGAAEIYRTAWKSELDADTTPQIEDVVDTARRQGRRIPGGYAQPTVIQYDSDSIACAKALVEKGETIAKGLPAIWGENSLWQRRELAGAPDKPIIEVWFPPAPVPVQKNN